MSGWWITSSNQDVWEKYQHPQICRWYHWNGRKWRGTKELLMREKKKSEKAGLKLIIQKTKTVTSGHITSWQMERVTDFICLGSKITVDSVCSHEIKRCLLLGRKAITNLWKWKWSHSVVSDSLRLHGLQPTRLLSPWNSPGKNTGVGCHFLLQGFFPTQGSNPGLLHPRQTL